MGKKRKTQSSHSKACWSEEMDWTILGWLDFCIEHAKVLPLTEDNLCATWHCLGIPYHNYTWTQIVRRLHQLWDWYGGNDTSKKGLYVNGSTCLTRLPPECRNDIVSEFGRLESLLRPIRLRPRRLRASVIRETPSASPLTLHSGASHSPECETGPSTRLTPRAHRHQTRELAKQSIVKWESPEDIIYGDETPRKIVRLKFKLPCNADLEHETQTTKQLDGENETCREHSESETCGSAYLSRNEVETVSSTIPSSPTDHGTESTPSGSGNELRPRENLTYSRTTTERLHKAALRKKDRKIVELQELIDKKVETINQFQVQLDSIASIREGDQTGLGVLEDHVAQLNLEINHLKIAMEKIRKRGTFTKLAGAYVMAREEMKIESQIPRIRHTMKDVLGSCDDDVVVKYPGPQISPGLRKLLLFGFGLNLSDRTPFAKELFDLLISNRPSYVFIGSLIDASVCSWVLKSSFPKFDTEVGDLSLFKQYRELIASQDGAIALRNLELASYHALINTPRFQRLLDAEAEELAASLSETLAPLFPRNAEASEENVFETWGEEENVWKARQERLVDVYSVALKVKADSLITPERYELVYYPPGSVFDPATMKVETIGGAPVERPAGKHHKVEHCVHVSIQAFTREAVEDSDPVSKATIQSENFTDGPAIRAAGIPVPFVLVKAVVVLEAEGA